MKFDSQYSFKFNNKISFLTEDFVCSDNNRDAYRYIARWPESWPSNSLVINGPAASGKTHLAKIWQERSDAVYIDSETVMNVSLERLIRNAENGHLIIEDIDRLDDLESQEKVFHLFNKVISKNNYILLTSSKPVLAIDFKFNDLKSRMLSSVSVNINEPDDEMMRIIFSKYFSDIQLNVPSEVMNFLIPRVERNFKSVKNIVSEIDKRSFERKRGITIPFVKEILSI